MSSKRHVVVDGNGLPLALYVSSGAEHDLQAAATTVALISVPRRVGRARTRPLGLAADCGYSSRKFREYLHSRGIRHSIPQSSLPEGRSRQYRSRVIPELSAQRWKVERFFAWLNGFRRLGIRFERYSEIYLGFLYLAAIKICLRRLLQ
jgi:transposase